MKLAFWRRIAAFVVVCLAALIAAPAVAQFTAVSASQLGGTGNLVANATIYFQPMQSPSGPVGSARIDTTGGQMLSLPYLQQVTTGAFSTSIPDALASNPTICYAVTVIDNVTLNVVLGAGMAADGIHVAPGGAYGCVQPTGSTWSFDTYTPTGTGVPLQVAGPPGATGVTNWRGAWAATTAYAKNDGFVQAGNGYIVTTAYTSGSSFGSTDTTNSVEISTGVPAQ